MKNPKSISLIFPVYKDKHTVLRVVKKSLIILSKLKKRYEIIIVDDCCPEKSGEIALRKFKKNKKINIYFHKKNFGYGAAIRTGLKKSKYECVYAVDGDGEFGVSFNDLPRILDKFKKNDLVITYRYKKRYNTMRIMISGIYNVADDEPLSTNEVVLLIAKSLNRRKIIYNISPILIKCLAKAGDVLRLPLNSERLNKLTESYVVCNKKILNLISKPLPISSKNGLSKTFLYFKKQKQFL